MTSFLEHTYQMYGRNDTERHEQLLDTFNLPEPQAEEWVVGNGCQMIFLNEYGLVLKTLNKPLYNTHIKFGRNNHILQPLRHVELELSGIFLLPGILLTPLVPQSINEERHIYSRLYELGLNIDDIRSENIGFLKINNDEYQPTLLDHGCINNILTETFNKRANISLQKELYRPLRNLVQEFWYNSIPDKGTCAINFLNYCQENIQLSDHDPKKLLFNGWLHLPEKYGIDRKPIMAQEASLKYASRCQKFSLAS